MIDRPNSPQSVILLGRVLPLTGDGPRTWSRSTLANEVLGSGFLSRLNMDLREDKGWTYGVQQHAADRSGTRAPSRLIAPVQCDRTADSIRADPGRHGGVSGNARASTPTELQRVTEGNIRGLPNHFETNGQVLGAILRNDRLGRPDDYYATLAGRSTARSTRPRSTPPRAVSRRRQPGRSWWSATATKIDDQLKTLNLPIEYLDAAKF